MTWQVNSTSSAQTERLAEQIGSKLRGGELLELISDVGGGKTTFTRGLARGAGSTDVVASPTFTVSKVYQAGPITLHHFDFYRLQDPGLVAYELAEVVHDPRAVAIVEWADSVQHVLPEARMVIVITNKGEEQRELTITCPPSLAYLCKGLPA